MNRYTTSEYYQTYLTVEKENPLFNQKEVTKSDILPETPIRRIIEVAQPIVQFPSTLNIERLEAATMSTIMKKESEKLPVRKLSVSPPPIATEPRPEQSESKEVGELSSSSEEKVSKKNSSESSVVELEDSEEASDEIDDEEEESEDEEDSIDFSEESGIEEEEEKWLQSQKLLKEKAKARPLIRTSSGRKVRAPTLFQEELASTIVEVEQKFQKKRKPTPVRAPEVQRPAAVGPALRPGDTPISPSKMYFDFAQAKILLPVLCEMFCSAWHETVSAVIDASFEKLPQKHTNEKRLALANAVAALCQQSIQTETIPTDEISLIAWKIRFACWIFANVQKLHNPSKSKYAFVFTEPLNREICPISTFRIECVPDVAKAIEICRFATLPCEMINLKVQQLLSVALHMRSDKASALSSLRGAEFMMENAFLEWANCSVLARYNFL